MRSVISLFRPKTPISTIDVKQVSVILLNDRDPTRVVHHVHCLTCRQKMLPSNNRVFYCMLCKVAYSEYVSYMGPWFINEIHKNGLTVHAASA